MGNITLGTGSRVDYFAILQTMEYLESIGYEVTYLPVDEKGVLRLDALEQAIRPDTIPTNWFTILPNAVASYFPVIPATAPLLNRVVIMYMDTRPARPAVPSLS